MYGQLNLCQCGPRTVQIDSAIVHSPDNSDIVPYRMYLQSTPYINVLF
jgi:hypothetical protein